MAYSFTEKKRIRKDFSKLKETLEIPYLLATQIDSYRHFLQAETQPSKRKDSGLQASFKSVFPMTSYNGAAALEFVKYRFDEPAFDEQECRVRGMTYAASSEERRVGIECVITCRSRGSPYQSKKKKND